MSCAKGRVRARLTLVDGRVFHGENLCDTPQPVCPREVGEGYAKCKDLCQQRSGHAEESAIAAALREGADLPGATMEVEYRLYDRRWVPTPHICTQCRIACEWRGINVYLVEAL